MPDSISDPDGVGTRPSAVAAPRERRALVPLRPEHLYKAIALAFLFAFLFRFITAIANVLLLLYAAAILAVLFNSVISRLPAGRKWMTALIGVLIFGGIAAAFYFGVPALVSQVRNITGQVPAFEAQLQNAEGWIQDNTGFQVQLVGPDAQRVLRGAFAGTAGSGNAIARAQSVLGALFIPLLILFGGLFAVANPNERLLLPFLRTVPSAQRDAFRRIFELLGVRLIGWLKGTLISMLAVGTLSVAAYYFIGVPNALLLGLFAGLTEFVPLLGPWVGGAVAVVAAFLDDPQKAVWTAMAALAIQQVESNVITPWAMSKAADIHPFVTLFALVFFGSLFGFLGILLSIPLVIFVWTVIQVLWVERAIDTDEDSIEPVVEE